MVMVVARGTTPPLPYYSGSTLSDPTAHDGRLSPVAGVHSYQTMRACRAAGGWTYNHQPMITWWNGRFYLHYISNEVGEHIPPCCTMLQTSADGRTWTKPETLFPQYPDTAHKVVMHQRVGFYNATNGVLLAIGAYGKVDNAGDSPNDGNGIGRVVREIKKDGTVGDIFFVYYNHGYNSTNTPWPHYTKARSKAFRTACEEMIDSPTQRMQWVEEADRGDTLIPLSTPYKAFCYYTRDDSSLVAFWKHALTAVSTDGGHTWSTPATRAQGFVNSNAKIWAQRLSDGTFAAVYNPAEYRWPLALSTSTDGTEYTTLNVIHGDVPPMRYAGQFKSYGPQYPRGIQECNDAPADSNLWVAFSVNKEDIWVASIDVPVTTTEGWNTRSGLWARVTKRDTLNTEWLSLEDWDPFLDAYAERIIQPTRALTASFDIIAAQATHGTLQIELTDNHGTPCARLDLTPEGIMRAKGGARYAKVTDYTADSLYHITIEASVTNRNYTVFVNGRKRTTRMMFAPVKAISRIIFRTGERRTFPTIDTPADVVNDDEHADSIAPRAAYLIGRVTTTTDALPLDLVEKMREYVDYFNTMEEETMPTDIPNDSAAAWMEANIPLFECSNKAFEEMYYYRWWTLRKHLKRTPVGWAMTEFIVDRPYADKYNLIACALGHHIYETRWLRNKSLADSFIRTWYRGNDSGPMEKLHAFSSWNADAIYNRFLVTADTTFIADLYPDIIAEYEWWESNHRLPSGLYWQSDVADGMEESISGGRKVRNARVTINAYMFGNAKAIAAMAHVLGHEEDATTYEAKATEIKNLIISKLWNAEHAFFETLQGDTLSGVREAIGYLPWYFNMLEGKEYSEAFEQIDDSRGFCAPYGLTTAEQRHPAYRTHGTGRCEWDGAVWPFATSQTLTAMIRAEASTTAFYREMTKYVESQYKRGKPYIGEYLDGHTGYWLKGDAERSKYYNHSTFADLLITGIAGLQPAEGDSIIVTPRLPEGTMDYFRLVGVPYHGKTITIEQKNGITTIH